MTSKTLQSFSRRWWRRMRLSRIYPVRLSGTNLHSILNLPKNQVCLPAHFYRLPYRSSHPPSPLRQRNHPQMTLFRTFICSGVILIRMVYPSYRNPYSLQYSRPGYLLSRPRLGLTVFPRPDCRTTLSLGLPCPVAHGPLVRLNPLCSLQFLSVS
ncbi:hypothetical protein DPEC_G00307030 [Dallia pectoralis]|uniref:Uncharacterized protein n=1 Tax=Dallia pectoralis TaxID=75939 RepID=A0ACC2FE38_DALPE|nr:hypothetical protein DPEC_G00307030 [Dallia pectoralis]